mmetsp:Transcript_34267/g.61826  ORF Transcript_34267/g.61826 Transcript_34267/m.61826 type:complete len:390 (+) Transcript_34267:479-1648(+)
MAWSKSSAVTGSSVAEIPAPPSLASRISDGVNPRNTRLIPFIAASRQMFVISSPEYPSNCFAIESKSTSAATSTVLRLISKSWRRCASPGSGIYTRFSRRRRMASSMSHGKFVAAKTNTCLGPSFSSPPPVLCTPSTWTSSSVLTRRLASCSPCVPRWLHNESTSSMKMMEGALRRAKSNNTRTSRSLSPRYLLASVAELTLKNVHSVSVAAALASMVFPVPGGPNRRTPLTGRRIPVKNSGMSRGSTVASSRTRFGSSKPAMSDHLIPGLESIISLSSIPASSISGPWYCFRASAPVGLEPSDPPPPPAPPGPFPFPAALDNQGLSYFLSAAAPPPPRPAGLLPPPTPPPTPPPRRWAEEERPPPAPLFAIPIPPPTPAPPPPPRTKG